MSYTINYLEDKNIVQVKIQGKVNFRIVQHYSIDAVKLAHDNNCNNFLFDHSKTKLESGVYKIHADGDALQRFGFKITDKIAIVISVDKNDAHLSEVKDANIKWSNFRSFNDEAKAFHWLEENR
jgi:hypothetical protein